MRRSLLLGPMFLAHHLACQPVAGTQPEPEAARQASQGDAGVTRADVDDDGVVIEEHEQAGAGTSPGTGAGPNSDAGTEASADAGSRELVVVTLNTHSFQEGPDSIEALETIGAGLASLDVDIVGLNEIMAGEFFAYGMGGAPHDGAAIVKASLEQASGVEFHLARVGFAHWDTGEEMSNAILSRTPFVELEARAIPTTDFWPAPTSSRNVVYARTLVDGLGPVNVFVTHAWGWTSSDTRPQVDVVKAFMAEKFRGDEGLDLLLGDLNIPSTWDAYGHWLGGAPFPLVDTFAVANPEAFAAPTLFDESEAHRIDYILAGRGFPIVDEPGHFASAIIFDGVELPRVSDHKGVVTVFTQPASW